VNDKRKSIPRFFLLMRSRIPPISSEFLGGVGWGEHPKPPLVTPLAWMVDCFLAYHKLDVRLFCNVLYCTVLYSKLFLCLGFASYGFLCIMSEEAPVRHPWFCTIMKAAAASERERGGESERNFRRRYMGEATSNERHQLGCCHSNQSD